MTKERKGLTKWLVRIGLIGLVLLGGAYYKWPDIKPLIFGRIGEPFVESQTERGKSETVRTDLATLPPYKREEFDLRKVTLVERFPAPAQAQSPAGRGKDTVPVFLMDRRWPLPSQEKNHPVMVAESGLNAMSAFEATGDPESLAFAEQHAKRLTDIAVISRQAMFFPYDFDVDVHGDGKHRMESPWVSGMAQGEALSLFSQLHMRTGNGKYLEASHRIFRSLVLPPRAKAPWGSFVDSEQRFWIEEYPHSQPMRVFNGHVWATLGLVDYAQISDREDAKRLLMGALTTAKSAAPHIVSPGKRSFYCLKYRWHVGDSYNQMHMRQMEILHDLTGDAVFERVRTQISDSS